MEKEPWSGNINFWFMVCGLSQFLSRGNSCKNFFGSWWLVVIKVLPRGGLWWLVGASYDLLDSTCKIHHQRDPNEG